MIRSIQDSIEENIAIVTLSNKDNQGIAASAGTASRYDIDPVQPSSAFKPIANCFATPSAATGILLNLLS